MDMIPLDGDENGEKLMNFEIDIVIILYLKKLVRTSDVVGMEINLVCTCIKENVEMKVWQIKVQK
jgi:hypothetical protein